MDNKKGTWILQGAEEDSGCIYTAEQLAEYIHEVGFVPLFKNKVAGFSIEEHTIAADWWSGDPGTDPWEWCAAIAGNGEAAYGGFFDYKCGFISKEWFPFFANYRRDGYDFDALWDDEKAGSREKKIMDLFRDDTKLQSFDIKKLAGFGRMGEKNFKDVLASLQMQAYLCVLNFRRKRNRRGSEYGWTSDVYIKPELLWGYEYLTSAYKEEPSESFRRIKEHISGIFSEASESQLNQVLGIGADVEIHGNENHAASYPENLMKAINKGADISIDYKNLSKDQMAGLDFAISQLKENEQEVIRLRYEEGLSLRAVGEKVGLSSSRIGQIHAKALRKLSHPSRRAWYVEGYEAWNGRREAEIERIKQSMSECAKGQAAGMLDKSCLVLGIGYGIFYRLREAGIETIGELQHAMRNAHWHGGVNGIGYKSANILVGKMLEFSLVDDSYEAVKEYKDRQECCRRISGQLKEAERATRIFKRREVDYPSNILKDMSFPEMFCTEIDCSSLTEDQKLGVESLITATGALACWMKGGRSRPVTPEVLHYYFREGMSYAEIGSLISRQSGMNYVQAWRGRMFRVAAAKAFFLWVIHGASYTISAEDVMDWRAKFARKAGIAYGSEEGEDDRGIWDYYVLCCRREFMIKWTGLATDVPKDWDAYARECFDKLCDKMQNMRTIMTGTNWLEAGGLPEGFRVEETGGYDGVCTIWKEGTDDKYCW